VTSPGISPQYQCRNTKNGESMMGRFLRTIARAVGRTMRPVDVPPATINERLNATRSANITSVDMLYRHGLR
jgi:hypothetical protein